MAVNPRISVVVATLNDAAKLEKFVESFSSQNYKNKELLIADGGSSDDTARVLQENSGAIAWMSSQRDDGLYDAWNLAIGHASGDWVLFLGADDQFADSAALSRAAAGLGALPESVQLAYGRLSIIDEEGKWIRDFGSPLHDAARALRDGMYLPHSSTFHRRELFSKVGPFRKKYKIAADYDLLLRTVNAGFNEIRFLDTFVVLKGSGGVSDVRLSDALIENLAVRRDNGVNIVPVSLIGQLVRARLVGSLRKGVSMVFGEKALSITLASFRSVKRIALRGGSRGCKEG